MKPQKLNIKVRNLEPLKERAARWSYSTVRFLIVVQLLGKPQPPQWRLVAD